MMCLWKYKRTLKCSTCLAWILLLCNITAVDIVCSAGFAIRRRTYHGLHHLNQSFAYFTFHEHINLLLRGTIIMKASQTRHTLYL